MTAMTRLFFVTVLAMAAGCGSSTAPAAEPAPSDISTPPTANPKPEEVAPDKAPVAAAIRSIDIVGSWKTDGGDFQEITIDADGEWSSFLHSRPFYSGTWSLSSGTLTLTSEAAGAPMTFAKITLTDEGITGEYQGKPATWTRIK